MKDYEEENEPIHQSAVNSRSTESHITELPKSQLEIIGSLLLEYLSVLEHYLYSICAVSLACFVIYYTNFFDHLFNDPRVDTFYFRIAVLFYCAGVLVIAYVSVYTYFKDINDFNLMKLNETFAPIGGLLFLIGGIAVIKCVWGVYYYFSLIILPILAWGFIMTANFAPRGCWGDVFCVLLVVASLLSGKFINHKGHTYY